MTRPQPPPLGRLLGLLWRLRLRLAARRLAGGASGWLGAAFSSLVGLALTGSASAGTFLLFRRVLMPAGPVWLGFGVSLLCFLLGLLWLLWPLIAAQIDEAFELSRFSYAPFRPRRLYLAQTILSLLEPAALLFYAPLVGLLLALAPLLASPTSKLLALPLAAAYVLMNITCGRALANALLGVLASRRSSELLFSAFLGLLLLSFAMPTVDASWLFSRFGSFGAAADLRLLVNGAASMRALPGGWLATGLLAAMEGKTGLALAMTGAMSVLAVAGWGAGLWALERFYRSGQGLLSRRLERRGRGSNPADIDATTAAPAVAPQPTSAPKQPSHLTTLLLLTLKELRLLYANPRTRLLFAVPFFLLILLKIVGAPQLLAYLAGERWATTLLAVLAAYLVTMLAAQLFANGLGYEGPALLLTFITPQPLWLAVVARNLAQGAIATLQFALLTLLTLTALPGASAAGLELPWTLFPYLLLVALAAGNQLTQRYPRRFSAALERKDRVAPAATAWLFATLAGAGALATALWRLSIAVEGSWLLASLPLLGALVYGASLPPTLRHMEEHKGALMAAIARRD